MLDKDVLEEINIKLDFLHSIVDNTLYHGYSVQGLQTELEGIRNLQAKISEAINGGDEDVSDS